MRLVVLHYHLRPGGIRRVIELAVPHLVSASAGAITCVVLATGQKADSAWHRQFARQLPGVKVETLVDPSFHYISEQHGPASMITSRIRSALGRLFQGASSDDCAVWAHNLGVGRNLLLARELAAACGERDIPLVSHHHDWWFDNRWARWPEIRRSGFRGLSQAASAVFPRSARVVHVAINHADAALLQRHLGDATRWIPNLAARVPAPPAGRIRSTKAWLKHRFPGKAAPVWLLPCRTLRRKNIAEALLLTRWLRPEAWLVVTGAASSEDEAPYFQSLEKAARKNGWKLKLGILAGDESRKPCVPDLLAASEAVLLTSIQEGFGLPYLEAAAAGRPLIARRLPNIGPDLHRFGFRFPQAYDEIQIDTSLFDWTGEQARQKERFKKWRAALPGFAQKKVSGPKALETGKSGSVPFSRLTLTAQLEILALPPDVTWKACRALNPFLVTWKRRAAEKGLSPSPWPDDAGRWLGGEAYAKQILAAFESMSRSVSGRFSPTKVQSDFISARLDPQNLYPLLWNKTS